MSPSETASRPGIQDFADYPLLVTEFRESATRFAVVSIAWLILMVGSAFGGRELLLSGVSVPPLIFLAGASIVVAVPSFRRFLAPTAILLVPVFLLGLMLFMSTRPDYGAYKFFNLLIVAMIAVPLLHNAAQRFGVDAVAKTLVVLMIVLLAAAIVFKLRNGFFDRQVLFLMNGPIVFGRLMGVAAFLSLLALSGPKRYVAFAVFSMAVLWTMSKGPLLALMMTSIIATFWLLKGSDRWWFLGFVMLAAALLVIFAWDVIAGLDWGRLTVLWGLLGKGLEYASTDSDSLGARYIIYITTFEQIVSQPLGVGLGSWSTAIPESFSLDYPHNIVLELWSECGIVLGTIGLIPFLLFLVPGNAALRGAGLFLLLAQMVSGDLLDARYLLCFSLLAYLQYRGNTAKRIIEWRSQLST
jgi:hypothetical protein